MSNSATGQKVFGSGYFYGVPTAANPTPTAFGAAQNMSADFKRDIKPLWGTNQLPIEIASGKLTVTGKVEMATLNGRLVNDLLLGTTLAAGETIVQRNELGAVPSPSGPYTITVANSATWTVDLGVVNSTTFVPLVRVASGPTTGQYSVAAGVYTFAAADAGNILKISYEYTQTSSGQTVIMTNQPMGKVGNFQAVMSFNFGSEKSTLQFNNAMSSGFSLATKLDDYMMPSFDFGCGTDATDTLGTFSFAEVN